MKKYIKPQMQVICTECCEMLATSLPVNNEPNTDIVISEPEDVLTKKSIWDEQW